MTGDPELCYYNNSAFWCFSFCLPEAAGEKSRKFWDTWKQLNFRRKKEI